jgi:hypothetical protein
MDLGSKIRDQGSGKNLFRIPGSGYDMNVKIFTRPPSPNLSQSVNQNRMPGMNASKTN